MSSAPRHNWDLARSFELRTVVAATIATLACGSMALDIVRVHTTLLYDDLRAWKVSVDGGQPEGSFRRRMRPQGSQAPFRLTLDLRHLSADKTVVARRTYRVATDGPFCFEAMVGTRSKSTQADPGTAHREAATLYVEGRALARAPVSDAEPTRLLTIVGIEPARDERIDVRLETSRRTGERPVTLTLEFVRLAPCIVAKGGGEAR